MSRYSEERKSAVVKKLLPPLNRSVAAVAREEGITDVTLYHWRKQAMNRGEAVPGNKAVAEDWPAEARLAVVVATTTLSAVEVATYCREKGRYVEQVGAWRQLFGVGAGVQNGWGFSYVLPDIYMLECTA